jgi:phosphoglycerate dehydrogenase-like enzyme
MSSMLKLVIHPSIDDRRLNLIRHAADPMWVINTSTNEEAITEIADADAFFGKLTAELLANAKQLRWVQSPTASLEHYLFPELIDHPCVLTNMRGLFSDVVADHAIGMVLCFARNLHIYIRQQQSGIWSPVGDQSYTANFVNAPGTVLPMDRSHQHLSDCTLGVVGVGHIGAEILRRAAAFGMKTLGVDPFTRSVPGIAASIEPLEQLTDMLAECDYVVIAAPHTPVTAKLFRYPLFRAMKQSAVLVNVGRGAIVDLNDLTEALSACVIAGAALDVCDPEPLPPAHPLWRMPNVVITPHVAAASPRIAERHLITLLENVSRFVCGEQLNNQVNKRAWF